MQAEKVEEIRVKRSAVGHPLQKKKSLGFGRQMTNTVEPWPVVVYGVDTDSTPQPKQRRSPILELQSLTFSRSKTKIASKHMQRQYTRHTCAPVDLRPRGSGNRIPTFGNKYSEIFIHETRGKSRHYWRLCDPTATGREMNAESPASNLGVPPINDPSAGHVGSEKAISPTSARAFAASTCNFVCAERFEYLLLRCQKW
jgi:hypothetical protein